MGNLNTLLPQRMQGTLNADVALRDIYDQIIINSNLTLDSLYFDDVLIGNSGRKNRVNLVTRFSTRWAAGLPQTVHTAITVARTLA